MTELQQNAEKIREEMEAKQKELKKIEYEMWLDDIIHPKPLKVDEWKDDSPLYTPTVERMIAHAIIEGDADGKNDFSVRFSKIKELLTIQREELVEHQKILREYLDWFERKSITLSRYQQWQPIFAKYGLQIRLEAEYKGKREACAFCGKSMFQEPLIAKIYKSESDEGGYGGHHYESTHRLNIIVDADQPKLHHITLCCDKKALDDHIAEVATQFYHPPPNMSPQEIMQWCQHLHLTLSKLFYIRDSDACRIHTVRCWIHLMCDECFKKPDWSQVPFESDYKWIKPEWIRIIKQGE